MTPTEGFQINYRTHRKAEISFGEGVRQLMWNMVNASFNNKNGTKCT